MYTLLISENGSVTTTKYETIMQRSANFNSIQVLINKLYKGIDIADASIYMKYVLPVSKKIKLMHLDLVSDNYQEDYLQFVIPGNTLLTAEPGAVKITFTITKMSADENDQTIVGIDTTGEGSIKITAVAQWADFVPDELLNEVDQRLLVLEARQKDLDALHQEMFQEMANDVRLDADGRKILLTNKNGDVGSGVNVNDLSALIAADIVGADADGISDGVTHLDEVLKSNYRVVNLDKLVK